MMFIFPTYFYLFLQYLSDYKVFPLPSSDDTVYSFFIDLEKLVSHVNRKNW